MSYPKGYAAVYARIAGHAPRASRNPRSTRTYSNPGGSVAIAKRGKSYLVLSERGRVLGRHRSRAAAEKQTRAIAISKGRAAGHSIPYKNPQTRYKTIRPRFGVAAQLSDRETEQWYVGSPEQQQSVRTGSRRYAHELAGRTGRNVAVVDSTGHVVSMVSRRKSPF